MYNLAIFMKYFLNENKCVMRGLITTSINHDDIWYHINYHKYTNNYVVFVCIN